MNCLEFQRLSLSDPHCEELSFVEHSENCAECLRYVRDLRQMDDGLSSSLDVEMPEDLYARLKLNQEMRADYEEEASSGRNRPYYAIAASFVAVVFIAGFLLSSYVNLENKVSQDYESLLAGVVAHMQEQPFTPVWDSERANRTVNILLSSYGNGEMKMREIPSLQFTRLCPMGKYRGLHATLQTSQGSTTFAYIKGDMINDVLDTSYEGYVTRVKPLRDGNLVIISRNKQSLEEADSELDKAIYWEI